MLFAYRKVPQVSMALLKLLHGQHVHGPGSVEGDVEGKQDVVYQVESEGDDRDSCRECG